MPIYRITRSGGLVPILTEQSVPRRYAVVRDDGRMLADGYTSSRPELLPGEPFRIRVEELTSPRPPSACGRSGAAPSAGDDEGDSASPGRTTV